MLFDVACAMQEYFRATACPAKVYFGEEHLAEHTEELRVVWIPQNRDEFGAPAFTGSKFDAMYEGLNPRPIWSWWASADLHLWAFAPPQKQSGGTRQAEKDYAVLYALLNHTVLALHKLLTAPGMRLRGGNLKGPLSARRGFVYILPIQVQIPIVEVSAFPCDKLGLDAKTWTEAPITGVTATVQEVTAIPDGTVIDSVSFTVAEEE